METYEGNKPYIFISYAHANAPAVMEVLEELSRRGYRIWYDDGIEVGSEWPEYIASHLEKASLVLAFLSDAYMRSDNCRKEMHFALTKKIPVVNIFLEQTQMTPGMEMQIGNIFALMKHSMSAEQFYDRLFSAPQLDGSLREDGAAEKPRRRKKRKKVPVDLNKEQARQKKKKTRRTIRIVVALLLLAAAAALLIVGHFTGLTERLLIRRTLPAVETPAGDTVAVFTEPLFEAAARDFCGVAEGAVTVSQLSGLTELYFAGDRYGFDAPPESGGETGSVVDLSDLRYFTGLKTLSLRDQALASLETLPVTALEYLDLSGCRVVSLQGVGNLPKLREIITDGCPLTSLGDLNHCLQLRRVSLMGAHVSDFSAFTPLTKLAEFSVSDAAINDLSPVFGLSRLTNIALEDCDLRGSFFRSFDREGRIVSLSLSGCKLNSTANLQDFKGLTQLTLIESGETLDWSVLAELSALRRVCADESMRGALSAALSGSGVELIIVDDAA